MYIFYLGKNKFSCDYIIIIDNLIDYNIFDENS